jgi:hypothetical protein
MASHSPYQAARARSAAGCLILAALALACRPAEFSMSGGITATARLQKIASRPNMVLLIVASNEKGVPVAVHRVVNPQLPLSYTLGPSDLVLPGPAWHGLLSVQVYVNKHGQLGKIQRGDLRGTARGMSRSGERHANVVIDEHL